MKSQLSSLKNLFLRLVLFTTSLLASSICYSQNGWNLSSTVFSSQTNFYINSISVPIDHPTGLTQAFAVGTNGMIRKTEDGGDTWTSQTSGATHTLTAGYFYDSQSGIVVGNSDKILKTTNGGTTWSQVTTTGSSSFTDVTMLYSGGYSGAFVAVGLSGMIYKSTNGGDSWTAQTSNTTNHLYAVHSVSTSIIIAVGSNGTICRTTNGGTTWTVTTNGSNTLNGIGAANGALFIVGNSGTLLKSTDSGASWSSQTSGTSQHLNSIIGNSSFGIICGGSGTILKSTNGTSWTASASSRTDILKSLAMRSSTNEVFVASQYAFLSSKNEGGACTAAPTVSMVSSDITACVGDNISIVSSSDGTVGVRIWKRNDVMSTVYVNNQAAHPKTLIINNVQSSHAGTYTVYVENPCGSATSTSVTLTVNDVPAQPSVITIPNSNPTKLVDYSLSITNVPGTTYQWSAGSGGTVNGSGNTATIYWTTTGAKTVTVTPSNSCGTGTARTLDLNVVDPIAAPVQTPADNATGVALNATITLNFTTSNGITLVNGKTVTIKRSADDSVFETYTIPSSNVTKNGQSMQINPTGTFEELTEYYVLIDGGAAQNLLIPNNAFTGYSNSSNWNFTAGDFIAPTITSLSPADNSTNVAVGSNFIATFSESITAVNSKTIVLRKSADNSVIETFTLPSSNVTVSGNTVTINPTADLQSATGYLIEFQAGSFKDLAGNDFAGVFGAAWSFTCETIADVTPPAIASLLPVDNATDVSVSSNLTITFNENIQGVYNKFVSIKRVSDDALFATYDFNSGNIAVTSSINLVINPSTNLNYGTAYYVTIEAGMIKDLTGNLITGFSDKTTWNFTTERNTITWSGTSWSNGSGPTMNDNVIIAGNYTFGNNGAFNCHQLTINSGASLTINGDLSLTVNGNLINNGSMTVESGASLITFAENTVSGNDILFKRNTRYADGKYSFVGMPVVQNKSTTGNTLGSSVYFYDETMEYGADGINRWKAVNTDKLIAGKGYTQAFQQEITFTGKPNAGNITLQGTFSGIYKDGINDANEGWVLVSNPYPAAINVSTFLELNPNIEGAVYFWDDNGSDKNRGSNADYIAANSSVATNTTGAGGGRRYNQHIGAMQGYFVKLASTSDLGIDFTEAMRKTTDNQDSHFFRQAENTPEHIRLNLTNESGLFKQTIIGWVEGISDEVIDRKFDVRMFDPNAKNAFYSIKDTQALAIQGITPNKTIIPMGINIEEDGKYSISCDWSGAENMKNVVLYDALKDQYIDLSKDSYSFDSKSGKITDRFFLSSKSEILSSKVTRPSLYAFDNILHITKHENSSNSDLRLTNLAGISVWASTITESTQIRLNGLAPGIYIATYANQSTKLIIK
jgi:photosystem II stability/assembly factor-like uncharacterized protein/methionine-rich copper-binding protein CopC